MNKFQVLNYMNAHGDAVMTLRGEEDIVATTDFSTPYIRQRNRAKAKLKMSKGEVLVWSWTDNKFRNIPVETVKNIKPLSEILGNKRDG